MHAGKVEVLEQFRELQEVAWETTRCEAADGGVLRQVLTSGKKPPSCTWTSQG